MPTANYNLHAWTGSSVMAPEHLLKPNRVLDRIVHYVAGLLSDGRLTGAAIQTNKRIAHPGNGIVDGCAWSISSAMEVAGTCQAGSSATQIKDTANLTQADSYWIEAWVFGESGANNGYCREVSAFNQASGTLTVGSAFPSSFSAGDAYRVTFLAIKPDTLTNGVTNYVYGRRVTYIAQGWTTEANGIPQFYGSTSSAKLAGEIYLGTITLDGSGNATAVDNDPSSDVDTCYALEIRHLRGTTQVVGLAGGANTVFYVTHSAAILPGAFTTLSLDDADCVVEMLEHYEDDRFRVRVTNNDAYPASPTLTWWRYALVA